MKKSVALVGTVILLASLSSYIVEQKEKVYVEPAPVVEKKVYIEPAPIVEEKVEVVHPYHHHHNEVIIEEHHPVVEAEIKLK